MKRGPSSEISPGVGWRRPVRLHRFDDAASGDEGGDVRRQRIFLDKIRNHRLYIFSLAESIRARPAAGRGEKPRLFENGLHHDRRASRRGSEIFLFESVLTL
jgi:hypothetical protein